jgi:ketosteroid isomerase-like protein
MNKGLAIIFVLLSCVAVRPQSELQQLFDTEKAFERVAGERGIKAAYLEFLADDAIIFRPDAVNGKEFWKTREDPASRVVRSTAFSDISSNGMLGYTTGSWQMFLKSKPEAAAQIGQFVTIWERKPDGKYRASVDIGITHDGPYAPETNGVPETGKSRDLNKRNWSAADPSMNFLKLSMTSKAAASAYDKFAANDIRFLRDGEPPIIGKKNVVRETKNYKSLDFPKKVALFQSADMAYVWNPCVYSNNNEGTEKGNCLQVWKLSDNKWTVVIGVFARLPNETKPVLKSTYKGKNPK